jgi:hypothetical protein
MFYQDGYMQLGYLDQNYFTNFDAYELLGNQFTVAIDTQQYCGMQYDSVIDKNAAYAAQLFAIITKDVANAVEFLTQILKDEALATQFLAQLDKEKPLGTQFLALLSHTLATGVQFDSPTIANKAVQFLTQLTKLVPVPTEMNVSRFFHLIINSGYCYDDFYCDGTYFGTENFQPRCYVGTSFELQLMKMNLMQYVAQITKPNPLGMQFLAQLTHDKPVGMQFLVTVTVGFPMQFDVVFYNTYNLRILRDFPSRGDGTSWVASHTEVGNFDANNLNTDVVEQCWRSPVGITSNVILTCDTGVNQGVYVDTFAMLNHNLSNSANVVLVGATDAGFLNVGFTQQIRVTPIDAFYIAPDLPTTPLRYWRLFITDTANLYDYLQIGTIVFGSSIIFNGGNFANPLKYQKVHYADGIQTEGFSFVTNDRGIKKTLGLDFKSLEINSDNYEYLTSIFETQRTSLKCLWIPTPKYPERYAVFGKLSELPSEEHTDMTEDAAYVTLSVNIDESK